jgi:hypothetical protein
VDGQRSDQVASYEYPEVKEALTVLQLEVYIDAGRTKRKWRPTEAERLRPGFKRV